jgi:dimethylargininase
MARTALVRHPGPRLAEGLLTHLERRPVDVPLAFAQWDAYVAAMREAGWTTVEVARADDCPDAVFVEDTAVVHEGLAVVTRPGAPSRQPEVAGTREALSALGFSLVVLAEPATLDGGDVLRVGSTLYVGVGGRTNDAGVEALRSAFEPLGLTVQAVPVTRVLHLKSAVTALPDGTVVGYEPLVDDPSAFGRFQAVPEAAGAHVVLLDEDRLLMAASAPRTAELFGAMGYRPVLVDVSEYEKLEGCVTCLSVRLRQPPA